MSPESSSSSSEESEEDISTETITSEVLPSTSDSQVKRSHSPTLIGDIEAIDQIYEDGSSDQVKSEIGCPQDPLLTSDIADPNPKSSSNTVNQSSKFVAEQTHAPITSPMLYCPPTPDTIRRRNLEIVVETDESEIDEIKTTDHSTVVQNKLNAEYDNEPEENNIVETCQKDKEKTDNELISERTKEQSFEPENQENQSCLVELSQTEVTNEQNSHESVITVELAIGEDGIHPVIEQPHESCPSTLPIEIYQTETKEEIITNALQEQENISKELSEEATTVPSEDRINSVTDEESPREVQPNAFVEDGIYPVASQEDEATPSLIEENLVDSTVPETSPVSIDEEQENTTPTEKDLPFDHPNKSPGSVEEDSSIRSPEEHKVIPISEGKQKEEPAATEEIIPVFVQEQEACPEVEQPNDSTEVTTEHLIENLHDVEGKDSPNSKQGEFDSFESPEVIACVIDKEQDSETASQPKTDTTSKDLEEAQNTPNKDFGETRHIREKELPISVDQLQNEPTIEWEESQNLIVEQPEENKSVNEQANEQKKQFPINEESIHQLAPECETSTPTSCIVENIKEQTVELIINTNIQGIDESTDPIIEASNQELLKDIDYLGTNQKEKLVIDSAKVVDDQSITAAVAPQLKEVC